MTDKLLIERELLERLTAYMRQRVCPAPSGKVATELHADLTAALAATRQPEGGLPEPDFALDGGTQPCYYAETAQRAIAELREECERLRRDNGLVAHANLLRAQQAEAERDTLRQQLAERDAELAMLRDNNRKEAIGVNHLLSQRDKLAGLLREAKHAHGMMLMTDPPQEAWKAYGISERIDAALAEVNK